MPFKPNDEQDVHNIINKMLKRLGVNANIKEFNSIQELWKHRSTKTASLIDWEMWMANPVARPTVVKLTRGGINLIPIEANSLTIGWCYVANSNKKAG